MRLHPLNPEFGMTDRNLPFSVREGVKTKSGYFHALFVVVKMRGRPLANDDPKGPASCKWSFGGAGLLQMAAVGEGIGDSNSCMEIDFSCVKSVSEHI